MVYVSKPNYLHKQACLHAIAAGKHVLCEKPLDLNANRKEDSAELGNKEDDLDTRSAGSKRRDAKHTETITSKR